MIKFFRKIRQKAINNFKIKRYFFYAAGETLLLVFGILIALQINNWNEERKNREKENYYLSSIKSGLEKSLAELERVINDAHESYACAEKLLKSLAENKADDLENVDSLIFAAGNYSLVSLSDGPIQEVLNSAKLEIVKDEIIRLFIADWDKRIHEIRKYENFASDLAEEYLDNVNKYVDVKRYIRDSTESTIIPEKRNAFFDDPILANNLFSIFRCQEDMYTRYMGIRRDIEEVIKEIDMRRK